MPRLTISISNEEENVIKEKVEEEEGYESKSAFVRECIHRYDRVEELEARVGELRRQLTEANRRNEEMGELANYVEVERQMQVEERQRRRAPLLKRLEWLVFGYDGR